MQSPEPNENPGSAQPTEAQACFTACHYQIGMDHVRLIPPADLALSAEHSQALCHALAELCREDGLELQWLRADRWLARGPARSGVKRARRCGPYSASTAMT